MSKDLERADIRRNVLSRMIADQADRDFELEADAQKADELDSVDDGYALLTTARLAEAAMGGAEGVLRARGFESVKQLRRAIDAKKPQKDAPLYLSAALKRQEVRIRNNQSTAPVTNVQVVMHPPPAMDDVIDINEEKSK